MPSCAAQAGAARDGRLRARSDRVADPRVGVLGLGPLLGHWARKHRENGGGRQGAEGANVPICKDNRPEQGTCRWLITRRSQVRILPPLHSETPWIPRGCAEARSFVRPGFLRSWATPWAMLGPRRILHALGARFGRRATAAHRLGPAASRTSQASSSSSALPADRGARERTRRRCRVARSHAPSRGPPRRAMTDFEPAQRSASFTDVLTPRRLRGPGCGGARPARRAVRRAACGPRQARSRPRRRACSRGTRRTSAG